MNAQDTGIRIAALRKEKKLTQRELADRLHVTDKAVSKWERGVNFPDLGLMESLASELDTTPAYLLGLEAAERTEVVSALAELSALQLAEARRDIRIFCWGSLVTAALLALAYHLTQRQAVEVYYLLSGLIAFIGIMALAYLFKYGEIKKWEPKELGSFYGAVFPVLIYLGIQFLTGYAPFPLLGAALIALASVFAQIHFLQTMQPLFMKLLPLTVSLLFVLWQWFLGSVTVPELLPLLCCGAVSIIGGRKHLKKQRISGKNLGIGLCIVLILVLVICLCCYPSLVKTYVIARQEALEVYAQELLETGNNDTYGLWDVTAYPDLGLVVFQTGGHGLAPGSIYEGFYYSASGTHIPFPGFGFEIDTYGSEAWFRDPAENSDNWQNSTQFATNWFWFELHY